MKPSNSWLARILGICLPAALAAPDAVAVQAGIASNVTNLSAEALDSSSLPSVNELLNQLPQTVSGLHEETEDGAAVGGPFIRGLDLFSTRPLYRVDGVTYNGAFGLAIPSSLIDRVEIVKGGAAAIYGSEAAAGVVNIITKDSLDYSRFTQLPQDAGYAFTNALRDTYVAIDSTQLCDYTPAIHQSPLNLTYEKTPAEQRRWDAMWEMAELLTGSADINPAGEFRNGTLYVPPVYSEGYGSGGDGPETRPWFNFAGDQQTDLADQYSRDFNVQMRLDFGAGTTDVWTAKYRGGIPSWRTIELGYTPCTEADLSVVVNKKTLEQHYDDLYKAWADWSYHFWEGYYDDLSYDELHREDGPLREAERRRDAAKANIRTILAGCPRPATTAADNQAGAMPSAPAVQTGSDPDAPTGNKVGTGQSGLGTNLKFGALQNWRLEFRVQYEDKDGEAQPAKDTMICIGRHESFALPGDGVNKDPDTGHDSDPYRVFTDGSGVGSLDLTPGVLDNFLPQDVKIPILKIARNYSAFRGFTQADPSWQNFVPEPGYQDRSSIRGFGLTWKDDRLTFGMDLKYSKVDGEVVRLQGLGNGQTSVEDVDEDILDRFPIGARYYFNDAFSIGKDLYLTTLHPEYFQFDQSYFDSVPGVSGSENNSCAEEALPPPGDPAFKGRGAWGQDFDDQWAIKRVGLGDGKDSAWAAVKDSAAPIVIGIIDTGLDWHHLEIDWSNLWRNEGEIPGNYIDDDGNGYVDDIIGWDFLNNANNPWDYDGHGTFVTGIIAANRDNQAGIAGINPKARIMVLKALNSFGHTRASHVAKAIVYGADNGARILNLSLAGPGLPQVVRAAIEYAESKGVLVVAAAGNTGTSTDQVQPAGVPGVLTVAATDLDDRRPNFSNYGTEVDIAAPGVEIMSLRARRTDFMWNTADRALYVPGDAYVGKDKRYYRSAGTSFATPIVSGIASLVWANDPSLTAADVRRIIEQSARDIETPGRDQYSGYGIVDAVAALGASPDFFIDVDISGVQVVEDRKGLFLEVLGTLDADELRGGWLEFGAGADPTDWQRLPGDLQKPVSAGALGRIPAGDLAAAPSWTIRLIGEHKNGQRREYRFQVDLQ